MQTQNVALKIDFLYVTKRVQDPNVGERRIYINPFPNEMQWNKTCTTALPDFSSLSSMSQRFDFDTRSTFRKNAQTPNITDR